MGRKEAHAKVVSSVLDRAAKASDAAAQPSGEADSTSAGQHSLYETLSRLAALSLLDLGEDNDGEDDENPNEDK